MTYFLPTLTGLILRFIVRGQPSKDNFFDDSVYWEVLYVQFSKDVNDD